MQLSAKEINKDENLTVSFTVENTGKMRGTEICQLYLTDKVSSVSLPGKALKGFSRVELAPGEKKTVEIIFNSRTFFIDQCPDMQRVVEPGLFEISVGPSSATIELKGEVTVK